MVKLSKKTQRPAECDNCKSKAIRLTKNDILYGKIYGSWPLVWYCDDCGAAVGCHPNTDVPLGIMADRMTRRWRKKAHEAFDPIWRKPNWITRHQAYEWLAGKLGLETKACHIGTFTRNQCRQVIAACQENPPKKKEYRKGA